MDKELKKYRKQDAFKVPDDYFEDFAYRMQLQIGEDSEKISWLTKLNQAFQFRWSMPMFIVIALCYFSIWVNQDGVYMQDEDLQSFLLEESEDWMANQDLMDLAYHYQASTLEDFSDEDIENYLNEESSDTELILFDH
tara:strand:+ start:48 stop:461 length:414 start_codon:yes stop_codon:yes gene_type:complete